MSALAWARNDHQRAGRWLSAVRYSTTPTHNFLMTIAYRQLREQVGSADRDTLGTATTDDLFQEATDWLSSL